MPQSLEQFGQTVKAKYPQYANLPDADVANKVLEKYPQYKSQVSMQVATPQPAEQQPGLLTRAFNAVTGSEQAFGKTLGGALATSETVNNVLGKIPGLGDSAGGAQTIANQSGVTSHNATMEKIQQLQAGGDVEGANRLRRSLGQQNLTDVQAPGIEQVIPESQQSAKQIIGQGVGVLTDIASAGTYGQAAKAAQTGKLLTSSEKALNLAGKLGMEATGITANAVKTPLLQRAGAMAKEGAVLSGLYGGSQAAQEDKSAKDIFKAAVGSSLLGGALGGALPLAGAAIKETSKLAGRGVSEFLGKSTGAKGAAVREIFNNPDTIQYVRKAGIDPQTFQQEIVDDVVRGLKKVKDNRRTDYLGRLSKLDMASEATAGSLSKVKEKMIKEVLDAGGSYNNFDKAINLDKTSIVEGRNVLERVVDDIANWKDSSPAGLDTLKQRLDDYIGQLRSPEKKNAQRIVLGIKSLIKDELETNVKGYGEMTKGYAEASGLIDEIEKVFSLKRGRTQEQQLNKIMQIFRPGKERAGQLAKELQKVAGEDIIGKAAGASMAELTPKGLSGVIHPGIAFGLGNIPGLVTYLAASSPRLVAELMSLLGRIPKAAFKQAVFPPAYQQAIQRIIIKATNENLQRVRSQSPKSEAK